MLKHPNIRLKVVPEVEIPRMLNHVFFTRAVYKTLAQLWLLFALLMFKIPRPEYILCQNPPAIPLLAVACVVSIFRRTKFIIDWHNYGYTWLAVNRPGSTLLVGLYYIYERVFAKLAHGHLCVSKAMQTDLRLNWGVNANVLHDRPQAFFKRSSNAEKKKLFDAHDFGKGEKSELKNTNAFCLPDGSPRPDRPALLVSSTSWTADEDFSVLLDAVVACDERAKKSASSSFPLVRFVVTGKGDLRSHYQQKIAQLQLTYFKFYTEFLSFSEYATLLGSADLGVSLHFSSSKLDLPMKVVDMFGSELPVAAYDYGCLGELVLNGFNGFTFTTRDQLSNILFDVLSKFPHDTLQLDKFRENIREFKKATWSEAWLLAALPLFRPSPPPSSPSHSHSPTPKQLVHSPNSPSASRPRRKKLN